MEFVNSYLIWCSCDVEAGSTFTKETCCRCKSLGSCKNCSCSKNKKKCTNCLPSGLNRCKNYLETSENSTEGSTGDPDAIQSNIAITNSVLPIQVLSTPINASSTRGSTWQEELSDSQVQRNDSNYCDSNYCEWPDPIPIAVPFFSWGDSDSSMFIANVNKAYAEVIHWKSNLFPVPFGPIGKSFVTELARLYRAFAIASALEEIALKAATVLTVLALQRPYIRSKTNLYVNCLQRRMESWSNGRVDELLAESKTIQARTFKQSNQCRSSKNTPSISRLFAKLMFQGKCNSAFSILVEMKNREVF